MTAFDDRRWQLFLQYCDKQDLVSKGEQIKPYEPNFISAFKKAHNVAIFYQAMADSVVDKVGFKNDFNQNLGI